MEAILGILNGTPWWVWVILGYLLVIGIKAFKTQRVYVPKLFLVPSVLIVLKYSVFIQAGLFIWLIYLLGLTMGAWGGFKLAHKKKIKVFKKSKQVEVPGTFQTLIILMVFFSIKYVFGYLESENPELWQETLVINMGASALISGLLIGRAVSYLKQLMEA